MQYLIDFSLRNKMLEVLRECKNDPEWQCDPDYYNLLASTETEIIHLQPFEHNTEKAVDRIDEAINILEQAKREIN